MLAVIRPASVISLMHMCMAVGGAKTMSNTRREAPASFGAKFILAVTIIVTVGCAIGYVMEMNQATAKGYEIKTLEKSVSALQGENAKLNAGLATLQSMAAKQDKISMMGMVDVGKVDYVTPPGPVAIAK
jgi:hypothetical protein